MRPELRKEMLRILEELSKAETEVLSLAFGENPLTFGAVQLLKGIGALEEEQANVYRITIQGYAYYQELNAPRAYWIRKNWFPVAVLTVSSVVTVVTSLIVVLLG